MTPPISFSSLLKTAANPAVGGYPYQIRASDLDKNFVFATEDFNEDDFEVTTSVGSGGFSSRKVSFHTSKKLPMIPPQGTYVLGAVNGTLEWIDTEEC